MVPTLGYLEAYRVMVQSKGIGGFGHRGLENSRSTVFLGFRVCGLLDPSKKGKDTKAVGAKPMLLGIRVALGRF